MTDQHTCTYSIAQEFTRFPGGRLRIHGPFSGEEFRDDVLLPLLDRCEHVTINLSGANGYGASFLDESFGELGKKLGLANCRRRLELIADDDPTLVQMIWSKIERATQKD